ncbi:unnamed protein product, partial [Musa acuminata var. zebrina]
SIGLLIPISTGGEDFNDHGFAKGRASDGGDGHLGSESTNPSELSIRETEHDSSTHWSLDYCMIIHKRQSITVTLLTKKVISLLYRLGAGMLKASLLESFL